MPIANTQGDSEAAYLPRFPLALERELMASQRVCTCHTLKMLISTYLSGALTLCNHESALS